MHKVFFPRELYRFLQSDQTLSALNCFWHALSLSLSLSLSPSLVLSELYIHFCNLITKRIHGIVSYTHSHTHTHTLCLSVSLSLSHSLPLCCSRRCIFTPPAPMNHVNIFKGWPPRDAPSKLVQLWYKTFPPDQRGLVEMQNPTRLSDNTSTA